MSGSLPLEVGFEQSFSFILSNFSHGSCNTEYPFRPDIKVDEVKKAALDLTSKVRFFFLIIGSWLCPISV